MLKCMYFKIINYNVLKFIIKRKILTLFIGLWWCCEGLVDRESPLAPAAKALALFVFKVPIVELPPPPPPPLPVFVADVFVVFVVWNDWNMSSIHSSPALKRTVIGTVVWVEEVCPVVGLFVLGDEALLVDEVEEPKIIITKEQFLINVKDIK